MVLVGSRSVALISLLFLTAGTALAAIFPDVPENHVYREPIEMLVGAEVINGNPDGNFYPARSVNRAEMLKMLYKATGKQPNPSNRGCFPDVESGSWYEIYVCDAASNRYVAGYADGTFRPGNEVNRVESLKMIAEVFGFEIPDISEDDREVVNFVDVSLSAWYTRYLYAMFRMGVLPIAGQTGARFYPDWPLLRGEAAAYIYNALRASVQVIPEGESGGDESQQQQQEVNEKRVEFPFTDVHAFNGKKPFSYLFDIEADQVGEFKIMLRGEQSGSATCRLYLLDEDGFSDEYYLGVTRGDTCVIRAALVQGNYQLQLQPSNADVSYDLSGEVSAGDGNDGFSQARPLLQDVSQTGVLSEGDIADWYTFSIGAEAEMTLEATNSVASSCIVYAASDVDLYGFSGPQCNTAYTYLPGTYYVGIVRKNLDGDVGYTVILR